MNQKRQQQRMEAMKKASYQNQAKPKSKVMTVKSSKKVNLKTINLRRKMTLKNPPLKTKNLSQKLKLWLKQIKAILNLA